MIHIFGSVTRFFKFKQLCVDNNIFRLHYRFTAGVLIVFSILVSAYQFFGEPVRCVKTGVRQEALETFCWAHSTFSLPDAFDKEYGEEVPYPGVDNYKEGDEKVYHQYYQWVCFVLILQAIFFLIPHYLWKSWENGKIKNIKLCLDTPILDYKTKEENKRRLILYLKDTLKLHKTYFIAYILCEVLNFINVVGQIFLTDRFLGYSFTKYGIKIIQYTEMDIRERPDAMTYLFPKMAKCIFRIFGSGGSVEKLDVLCLLPLNVINEKIYVFLWFWFILLAILSAFMLVYRSLIIVLPQARYFVLSLRCFNADKNDLQSVLSHCSASDWFVLNLLAKNLEPFHYKGLITDLATELNNERSKRMQYIHKINGDKSLGHHV